jgi:ABC-type spermidine/putrescine transport system permease subunit I
MPLRSRDGTGPLLALPMLFLAAVLLLPMIYVVVLALGDSAGQPGFLAAVHDPLFAGALVRTVGIAGVVTAVCLVLGAMYALALVVTRGALRVVLAGVLLATFWISLLVRTLGWVLFLEPNGALDQAARAVGLSASTFDLLQTTPGMVPAMVHIMLPFAVLPIYAAFAGLDERQVQAARALGASGWLVVRAVVLPQVRAGIVGAGMLVGTLSLGFFVTPAFLGGPADLTLGTLIGRDLHYSTGSGLAPAAATGVILLAGVLIVYIVADRVFGISERWAGGRR